MIFLRTIQLGNSTGDVTPDSRHHNSTSDGDPTPKSTPATKESDEKSTKSSTSKSHRLGANVASGHKPPCLCPDKLCSSKLDLAFVIDASAGSEQVGTVASDINCISHKYHGKV